MLYRMMQPPALSINQPTTDHRKMRKNLSFVPVATLGPVRVTCPLILDNLVSLKIRLL